MRLWEAPEVVESDEELIECANKHGFYIYKKKDAVIKLYPCVCGYKRISTRSFKYRFDRDYGSANCYCPGCGLKAEVRVDFDKLNDEKIDWYELESKARSKWNNMITNILKMQEECMKGEF